MSDSATDNPTPPADPLRDGPDPDAPPPWVEGDDPDEDDTQVEDAAEDGDDADQDGGQPDLGEGNPREGVGAIEQHHRGGPRPPSPPRRTGIFVDADDLREYVGALLRSMLGGYEADAWGNFTFTHEDARIFITVGPSPVGPQVGVFSVTNVDVDLSPGLAGFLLTTNHQLGFGSFSYDQENRAVWLRHSLLGTTLDAPELQTAVAAVANTAHQANTHIAEQYGGRSFADAPKATQDAQRPPEAADQRDDAVNPQGYL